MFSLFHNIEHFSSTDLKHQFFVFIYKYIGYKAHVYQQLQIRFSSRGSCIF